MLHNMKMNNWYKISQIVEVDMANKVNNFSDRNRINRRIVFFKEIAVVIDHLVKGGYQDIPRAKKILQEILGKKELSSFPGIVKLLNVAYDVGLDSYGKFADACFAANEKIVELIEMLKKQRLDFVQVALPKKLEEIRKSDEQ